jgi:hypothetical protein
LNPVAQGPGVQRGQDIDLEPFTNQLEWRRKVHGGDHLMPATGEDE